MKTSTYLLGGLLVSSLVFIGCSSGGGSSEEPVVGATTVTVLDGYIKDANVTDDAGQVGVYTSNGKYTFANSIAYPLRSRGGALEDTNSSFDINMSAQSGLILSPITSFLENNSTLLGKLANLGLSTTTLEEFAVDYVDTNNSDLAKLSQLLYLVQKDADLLSAFKASLANGSAASLADIFALAQADVNATMGAYAVTYNAFLADVLNLTGSPSEYETQLASAKDALSEIHYNGTMYKTLTSSITDRVWLDRNLGASETCTARDSTACFGDYYQWGRNTDGHEKVNSNTDVSQATDIDAAGSSFIRGSSDWLASSIDDNGTLRALKWNKSDGTSVCPIGFRVPTITELQAENITDRDDGFIKLKLPSAGYRTTDGTYQNQGGGFVWSSNTDGVLNADSLGLTLSVGMTPSMYAYGFSVRCIEDIENQAPIANAGADQNITEGVSVTLDASASRDDDGLIVSYEWKEGNTSLSTSSTFTKSDFSSATHTITLTVTDNDGASSTDTVVIRVGIIHNGIAYGTVTSSVTHKIWLDRNLGASRVCEAYDDSSCYGDYYQWGREYDGHQFSTSATASGPVSDITDVGATFFIGYSDWTTADNDGALRSAKWSEMNETSICPDGYRVPTIAELAAETTAVTNSADAFNNFLKLPSAGYRSNDSGSVGSQGIVGHLWSSSVISTDSYQLSFGSSYINTLNYNRSQGFNVRCLKGGINIALNKSVTALTNLQQGIPANVTDGKYSTVWYSYQGSPSTISFVIDLGSSYTVNKISFLPSQTRNYIIESSTDNVNWTTQNNVTGIDFYGSISQDITINPTYNARYLRYTGTNGSQDNAYVGVIEFEVYGTSVNP